MYIDAKEFTYDENSVMMKTLRECLAIIFVHFTKLYIPSTLNTDYLLWHTDCAVKY